MIPKVTKMTLNDMAQLSLRHYSVYYIKLFILYYYSVYLYIVFNLAVTLNLSQSVYSGRKVNAHVHTFLHVLQTHLL